MWGIKLFLCCRLTLQRKKLWSMNLLKEEVSFPWIQFKSARKATTKITLLHLLENRSQAGYSLSAKSNNHLPTSKNSGVYYLNIFLKVSFQSILSLV